MLSPSSSRLIPVTIPRAFSMNGRLPPRKKPGHQAPAGAPEAVAADQVERLVLPEAGGPGHEEVGERGRGADLDQLGAGADFVEREHAGRRPPHQDQEVGDLGPERDRRSEIESPKVTIMAKLGL